MKVNDCFNVADYTVLIVSESLPSTDWREIGIDGRKFEPIPVMDAKAPCVAIRGHHDFTGMEIYFE